MHLNVVLSLSGLVFGPQDRDKPVVNEISLDDLAGDTTLFCFGCTPIYLERTGIDHYTEPEYVDRIKKIKEIAAKAGADGRLVFRKTDENFTVVNWTCLVELLAKHGITITVDAELKSWMSSDQNYRAFKLMAEQAKQQGYTLVKIY